MRNLCKSQRHSLSSADKIHFQILTPMICGPFHTNFSVINHNKLKMYSYVLQVEKVVTKVVNTAPASDVMSHREGHLSPSERLGTGSHAKSLCGHSVTGLSFYKHQNLRNVPLAPFYYYHHSSLLACHWAQAGVRKIQLYFFEGNSSSYKERTHAQTYIISGLNNKYTKKDIPL